MGQYADDVMEGLVDRDTGEVIDGEAPGYERSQGDADCFGMLHDEAAREGLAVRKCSGTHYQICDEHGPLVDVWPTTNKYRTFNAPAQEKALPGGARRAVKQALYVARTRAKHATALPEPEKLPPAVKEPNPSKPMPQEKLLARCKHLLNLALLRLAQHPGRINDAIVAEIHEVLP